MNKEKDTRHRILTTAINIISHKGYHHKRVDGIMEAADTSKGGVYFDFPYKQDIFLGLVGEFAGLPEIRILDSIEQQNGISNRIDLALKACIDTFYKYRKLSKIFLEQVVGLGIVFEEKQRLIRDRFVKIIKRHLDNAVLSGDIQLVNTQIAAYAWIGAINEVVIR